LLKKKKKKKKKKLNVTWLIRYNHLRLFVKGRLLQTRKKPSGYLLRLHQRSNETLKVFVTPFNREKMAVEDPTEDMVYVALY